MHPQISSATLIVFPQRHAGRFTVRDRIELLEWEAAFPGERGFSRMVLHEQQPIDGAETSDFLLLYAGEGPWARWGVSRRGRTISVWRCADGADIGPFDTMREALGAALNAAAWTPGRHRGRMEGFKIPAPADAARAAAG